MIIIWTRNFVWLLVVAVGSAALQCDPCIERPQTHLRVLWNANLIENDTAERAVAQAAMQQAALDLRVQLEHTEAGTVEEWNQQFSLQSSSSSFHEAPDAWIVSNPPAGVDWSQASAPVFGMNHGWNAGENNNKNMVVGWMSPNHDRVGEMAALEFGNRTRVVFVTTTTTTSHNHDVHVATNQSTLSTVLQWQGLAQSIPTAEWWTLGEFQQQQSSSSSFCPWEAILVADRASLAPVVASSCGTNESVLVGATFGGPDVYNALSLESLDFALMATQPYLQASLTVVLATLQATTDRRLALPLGRGQYSTGPRWLRADNVPSDTYSACELEAFPICQQLLDAATTASSSTSNSLFPTDNTLGQSEESDNNNNNDSNEVGTCRCTDRPSLQIGGVLHGFTSDSFWDPVYASAAQAAVDMNVQLDLKRFEDSDILEQQMAARIRHLCDQGLDGLFVSIPSRTVAMAVQRCLELRVPVISVNAGQAVSEQLGLLHHIGMNEYAGGYGAAHRMVQAGLKRGLCLMHDPGNFALLERCRGFADGLAEYNDDTSNNNNVEYVGGFDVPADQREKYVAMLQGIVRDEMGVPFDGDWTGIGFLAGGQAQIPSLRLLLEGEHPEALVGSFDLGDRVNAGLEDNFLLFGVDQQPSLQGSLPVYLLAYHAYTRQRLTDHFIASGPSFLTELPTAQEIVCMTNLFAVCPHVPDEEMNYIPSALLAVGYAAFCGLTCLCGAAVLWTYYYRERWVVRVSQPRFLYLVVLGTFVSSLSIVFLGFETGYRDDSDSNVHLVDAACMAVPWFYGIGFVVTFSALFAKIHRVKLIYEAGLKLKRTQVQWNDVIHVAVFMISVEMVILVMWQIVSPLRWERDVLLVDPDGFSLSSVGSCQSGTAGWYFFLVQMIFQAFCLLYALLLSFQTKDIDSTFAEGSYLSLAVMFMLQTLVVAVPISALVRDNTSVFYFIRTSAIFLQNAAVVLLIFVPKSLRVRDKAPTARNGGGGMSRQLTGNGNNNQHHSRYSEGASRSRVSEPDSSEVIMFEADPMSPNKQRVPINMALWNYHAVRVQWAELGFRSQRDAIVSHQILRQSTSSDERRALLAERDGLMRASSPALLVMQEPLEAAPEPPVPDATDKVTVLLVDQAEATSSADIEQVSDTPEPPPAAGFSDSAIPLEEAPTLSESTPATPEQESTADSDTPEPPPAAGFSEAANPVEAPTLSESTPATPEQESTAENPNNGVERWTSHCQLHTTDDSILAAKL